MADDCRADKSRYFLTFQFAAFRLTGTTDPWRAGTIPTTESPRQTHLPIRESVQ
ncbi:hypothetical protein RB197 [Rhodopirellula baltica SH 1]|uniref:Uncharacterized protein n=1 Tax=Rhodopirellula baltica (strain DSM 10527 / NCIMB 13988 / SH1) TaxID=243090 RepID=Q7UZ44_RHOBA|nr:hypothetical protein RB197 [Rhodopirellula baltica SH 1]